MSRNVVWLPQAARIGFENVLLTATARQHFIQDFPGPLSIKTVVRGEVSWRADRRSLRIDDSSFLVLNDGEPYSMDLDVREPVTTCCVFFARGLVESVARDLSCSELLLVDEPFGASPPLTFLSRLHPRDEKIMPAMRQIRRQALTTTSSQALEERFFLLAQNLLLLYAEVRKRVARIPAVCASTRAEIFRRVSRGREFLHSQTENATSLKEAAHAACLSPYHFHRSFTRAFGETPHTFVTRLRLEKAHRLLRTGLGVTAVCNAVGFESLGSFSALFRRHFGVPPSKLLRCELATFEKHTAGQMP